MGMTAEHFLCIVSVWEDTGTLELDGGDGAGHTMDATQCHQTVCFKTVKMAHSTLYAFCPNEMSYFFL